MNSEKHASMNILAGLRHHPI